ncbi:MAG: hypothetical protein OXF47_04500 [Nitrospira sp.]|nr:hypothetical protein [Nitrospira sp.]
MKREDFEDAVKPVLSAPLSDGQQRENREQTVAELTQWYKIDQQQ